MTQNKAEAGENAAALIAAMQSVPVLVAGDIMLDRFIYGHVERISPESPVPVLAIAREDAMLGGAGNALANLAGLRAKGHILSLIGDDPEGAQLAALTAALGAEPEGLIRSAERPTIVKTRFLAGHQQLLRTDFERKQVLSEALAEQILAKAAAIMPSVKALLLSDYGKGLLSPGITAALIALAAKHNIPVIVDPKGTDYSRYNGASAVTPNRRELAEATGGLPTGSDAEVESAARKLMETSGIKAVVATRGRDGITVIRRDERGAGFAPPVHWRGRDIEVFDVSGAGDTVIATIAAGLAAGTDLAQAAGLANLAGSIVVTKVGTAPIRAAELMEALTEAEMELKNDTARPKRQALLCTLEEAAEQVRRWRARGLKIGLTNGCFDILHRGHVSYLSAAREECDRLVVGLNRDASVRLLKGQDRPVHDEAARAEVLAALGAVDMVVPFGAEKAGADNTASALVAALQPDFYFKGGDYAPENIPEAPAVRACGGILRLMPEQDGHSTSAAVRKIRGAA